MKQKFAIIFLFFCITSLIGQNQKFRVTNSCDGFSYNFDKPNNWVLDSLNSAEYLAHSAIYKNKNDYENGGPLIQVFAFKKQDENTIEDLKFDVLSYERKYSNLKQKELNIKHSTYGTFCKEVYVEESFYQYIVYLNPGEEFEFGISVALNINETELDNTDFEIFKNLVESVRAVD